MKKLVIATDSYLPRWDGISRFLSEVIPYLKKEYDITVIAPDYGKIKSPVKLIQIPRKKRAEHGFRLAKFRPFSMVKAISKADLVFTQSVGPVSFAGFLVALLLGKKRVAFIHSIEWELVPKVVNGTFWKHYSYYLLRLITKITYSFCNLLIMPSESVVEMFNWRKINTRKSIVNLGTDAEKFKPENKNDAKKKLNINTSDIVIGYHGRISPEKNLITLVRAFQRLRKKNKKAVLLIVGEGSETIKAVAKEGIILAGNQNNVVPYLNAMDIYCQPSTTETTCLSVLEAMACQLPVITSKVGYIKDYIKNKTNGLFFEKTNSYDLFRKIEYLIEKPAERTKLGKAARKTVEENFKWSDTAEKLMRTLENV